MMTSPNPRSQIFAAVPEVAAAIDTQVWRPVKMGMDLEKALIKPSGVRDRGSQQVGGIYQSLTGDKMPDAQRDCGMRTEA